MVEIVLNALGWDHERCMAPMRATAEAWRNLHPGVRVDWTARPLESFNDTPVEEIAEDYDLLVVDHPFSGTAAATGCLAPLDELVPGEEVARLAADAIGPSHESYAYAGHQWALAVDAACQVGAVRDDLLDGLGVRAPTSWDDVRSLVELAPGRVAIPLYPTDAVCSLLTLVASRGEPAGHGSTFFGDEESGIEAIAVLLELVPGLQRDSFAMNPPRALDHMRDTDEIVAIPLTFGYTNYARPGNAARIRFVDIPSTERGPVGALLGGAGIAVSAATRHPAEAAAFAAWACSADVQRAIVVPAGGQPGSRSAWLDPDLDAACGGFFSGTLRSVEAATVRPRQRWWPSFQEAAGHVLAEALQSRTDPGTAAASLEQLFAEHRARSRAEERSAV